MVKIETLERMNAVLDAIPQEEVCLGAARAQYETYIDTQNPAFLIAARKNLVEAEKLGANPSELGKIRKMYEKG